MLAERINEFAKRHGSLHAAAKVLGVNVSYLTRLRNGEKTNPNARLLKKLGLKKVVKFEESNYENTRFPDSSNPAETYASFLVKAWIREIGWINASEFIKNYKAQASL